MRTTTMLSVLERMAWIPMGVWKRVALYPVLALVLGQGCGCRRLSLGADLFLVVVAGVGLAGAGVRTWYASGGRRLHDDAL